MPSGRRGAMVNTARLRNRDAARRLSTSLRRVGGLAALTPAIAEAHSFGRVYTLPVPFQLYAYGAAAARVLSFALVAYFATAHFAARGVERGDRGWVRAPRVLVVGLRAGGVLGLGLC